MNLSWIKVGSRVAVLAIIYLLLSVPNTKYQYFSIDSAEKAPYFLITDKLITNHISSIVTLSDEEKSRQYDSLVNLIAAELTALRSVILDIKSPIIKSMSYNLGLASALVSFSLDDAQPLLESLWIWRHYLKEQSLLWNISDSNQKLQIASAMRYIGVCEDFIVANKGLVYTKLKNSQISFDSTSTLSNMMSGDLLLSDDDISYSYPEQAKSIPELTPSLGIILINDDSAFYIGSSPNKGLYTIKSYNFLSNPSARRLILRLRDDLPELIANPAIPHQAANFVYDLAIDHNVDYDFTLNQLKRIALCEIGLVAFAYEDHNIDFITSFSPLKNEFIYGLKRLGIKNDSLATAPEIQYHPSIEVVGLQLSGEGVKIRNLEMASASASLASIGPKLMKSLRWRLPSYRLLKGYGHISSLFGNTPVIPNGMAPEAAIIHDYILKQKEELLPSLAFSVAQFEKENNYFPTYSMLCEMAKSNLASQVNK